MRFLIQNDFTRKTFNCRCAKQGWPGYVPGYIPIYPSWVFSVKNPDFFVESVFDKTFIIFYNNRSYYTFEVMGS